MASKMAADDLDEVTCAVCKDVYKNPVKISCNHSFCEDCISESWKHVTGNLTCPICRNTVDGATKMDMEMMKTMSMKSTTCHRCKKVVIFTKYRQHQRICEERSKISEASGSSSRRMFEPELGGRPNYYTFECPYCLAKNLDRVALLSHVKAQHQGDQTQVVCPICKVMPWGDTSQCSQNFPDHLNIRHNFDYDRFVDFNQEEGEALENTVSLSIEQY